MGQIYCIIGKSSTGKDTIYKRLLADSSLGLKKIVSYTTRPIRVGEKDGEEYHFVSLEEKDRLVLSGKVIEIRHYDTVYGAWYYFTVDDGYISEAEDHLIIGTVESFVALRGYYGKDNVIPVYINVSDGIRLTRALEREKSQSNPKYEEMCRRFIADNRDFADEVLKVSGIENIFNNDEDIDKTVDAVAEFIRSRHGN